MMSPDSSATGNVAVPVESAEPTGGEDLPKDRLGDFVRRVLDLVVTVPGLLLLLPVFGLIAIWIRSDSRGPVFYRGLRTGRYGKPFRILKFRTMYEDPVSYLGPKVTGQGDPRITNAGRWLRDVKLNELPQLINVLKGEMSLVGPRPEDPEITATWPEEVQRELLSVPPGITSPASVQFRNEESLLRYDSVMETYLKDIVPTKLRMDQLYVRHRSFWLDLDVLFWTLLLLLLRVETYTPSEKSLLVGPITRLTKRHLNWFAIDVVVTFTAIGITGLAWRSLGPLDLGLLESVGIAIGFAMIFSLAGIISGTNRISWSRSSASDVLDLALAAGLALSVAFLINALWVPRPLLPAAMILTASSLTFLGFVAARYRTRLIRGFAYRWANRTRKARGAGERVLIVGCGEAGRFLSWILSNQRNTTRALQVVGFADDDMFEQGVRINGLTVIGRSADIPELVSQLDVGVLVFAIHNIRPQERKRILKICGSTDAFVFTMPDVVGMLKTIASPSFQSERSKAPQKTSAYPWAGIPVSQVESWLLNLETTVRSGDLSKVKSELQSLQDLIYEPTASASQAR